MRLYFIALILSFLLLFLVSCEKDNPIGNSEENSLYESQKIFITYDEIFQSVGADGPDRVESFDMESSNLFVHPIGAFGLYQYNFSSKELKKLITYGSGNYIAYDSIYVFYEVSSYSISRYNLEKDSTDLQVNLTGLNYTNISGMDIYQHNLYVSMHSQDSGNIFLAKFDLDGNFLESMPYPRLTMHMGIHNDILYGIYYPEGSEEMKLSRFSLSTKSFLEDKPPPTENSDGIRIYQEKLYFTDYKGRFIGTIQMSELDE